MLWFLLWTEWEKRETYSHWGVRLTSASGCVAMTVSAGHWPQSRLKALALVHNLHVKTKCFYSYSWRSVFNYRHQSKSQLPGEEYKRGSNVILCPLFLLTYLLLNTLRTEASHQLMLPNPLEERGFTPTYLLPNSWRREASQWPNTLRWEAYTNISSTQHLEKGGFTEKGFLSWFWKKWEDLEKQVWKSPWDTE